MALISVNRIAPPRFDRRGFTLIELLVAIGVIGLLLALLLPAVQAAREAARRTQCLSNLRQMGIALSMYESVHAMFPPGQPYTGKTWSSNKISGHSQLLPHLDLVPLYNSINMSFVQDDRPTFPSMENHTARNTTVSVFLCPSDAEARRRNNYRFNQGRLIGRVGRPWEGPFAFGILPRVATMRDGLASTAFMSERVAGTFEVGRADRARDAKVPIKRGTPYLTDEEFIGHCLDSPPRFWEHTSGRYWFYHDLHHTTYNHNGTPNDPRPTCSGGIESSLGLHPPRSFHPGLVHVLRGDGSVTPINDSIAGTVWISLGTPDGGEIISN